MSLIGEVDVVARWLVGVFLLVLVAQCVLIALVNRANKR